MEKESIPINPQITFYENGVPYADNFDVKGLLGQGGIGRVFLAVEKNIGREVAIKELIPERLGDNKNKIIARFIREAKISGRLQHPGIVPVYEMNTKEDGTIFYVMKYVQGTTLYQSIMDCSLESPEQCFRKRLSFLDNLIAVCEAIGYAHSKGVIHRDLKPGNVIIGKFGETILLDWGLAKYVTEEDVDIPLELRAKAMEDDSDAFLTRQGALLGTPSYMAPEQINPRFGTVGPACDVYSLGVILFMILTGKKPYRGKPKEILEFIASDTPSPSARIHSEFIPPELAAICEKAMAKKKEDRFQNASEMAAELRAYRDGRLVSIYAYSKRELLKRFVAKNKIIISAAAAVMAAIIIGSGFAMHFAYAAHKARLRADRALVEVTAISGDAAALSRNSALKLDNYFHKLVAGMMKTTTDISSINFTQTAKVRSALDQLHASHPEIEAFFITTPNGKIIASSSSTIISQDEANLTVHPIKLKNYGEIYVSKAFRTANGENASVIQMPIRRQSTFKGMLSADMRMDKVVPTAIGFDPLKSEYQVWCMRPDGYILYDEDKNQVGRYLFTDEMFANFPELLALGQRMKEEPWGIGHYTFTARDQETIIYKIAAWDTFTPTPEINWKIVVTYPYISK